MYTELSTGVGLLTVVGIGLKFLNKKVDKTACKPIHDALSHNLEKGEKKFEELTRVQQKQSVILARIDERLIGISKKIDKFNGGR